MGIVTLIIFLISPIIATLLSVLGLIFGNIRYQKIYIFIISFALAIIAFYYNPTSTEDLYRHHLDVIKFSTYSDIMIFEALTTSTEQLSFIVKYLVSLTGNINYLQFIVTFISYYIIFYIVCDSAKINKATKLEFLIVSSFTVLSFSYLTICSNLWSTLGLLMFSLGIHFEYVKKHMKIFAYILYISSIFIHTSLIFALSLIILFKLLRQKANIKIFYILFVTFLLLGPLITFLSTNIDVALVKEIGNFYNNYFLNNEDFAYLHTSSVVLLYLSKLVPYLLIYMFFRKERTKESDLSFVFLIAILGLLPSSTFSIRFIPVVQLSGVMMLYRFMNTANKDFKILLMIIMVGLTSILGIYQYIQLNDRFGVNIKEIGLKNIVTIFKGR